jgi:hypothetical protein
MPLETEIVVTTEKKYMLVSTEFYLQFPARSYTTLMTVSVMQFVTVYFQY